MEQKSGAGEIIDAEYREIKEPEVQIAGVSENDAENFLPVIKQFLSSYAAKPQDMSMADWLESELQASLKEISSEEARIMRAGLMDGVEQFGQNLSSLNEACSKGQTKEAWLRDQLQKTADEKGMSVQEYGEYLSDIHNALTDSNQAMMEAIESKGGIIELDSGQGAVEETEKTTEWNAYHTAALALSIGKHASLAGIGSAALTTGYQLALKAAKGEEIKGADVIQAALLSDKNDELKGAAAGALKVGIERGIVPLLPKNLSMGAVANIACVGIENAKIFSRLASGEINSVQALEQMARNSVATISGLSCEGMGAAIGASLLSFVPVVGTTVGGIVGGLVGRLASTKIGQAIQQGIQKIKPVAVSIARKTYSVITNTVRAVGNTIKSGLRKIASFLGF